MLNKNTILGSLLSGCIGLSCLTGVMAMEEQPVIAQDESYTNTQVYTGPVDHFRTTLSGAATNNASANTYDYYWASVVNSYLMELENGNFCRVENTSAGLLVDEYLPGGQLLSSFTLSLPLDIFGGFYEGADAYYVVSGQTNEEESADKAVIAVVKFDKNWNELASMTISDINTTSPFRSGSLRMAESDADLYIYTSHLMYAQEGINHQANMIFRVDKNTLELKDHFTDILNNDYGYVSHSFNQFIEVDDGIVYRADHGDAFPRGMIIFKHNVNRPVTEVDYALPYTFRGELGFNFTGAMLGDMAVTENNILLAGTSIDQAQFTTSETYNVFLTITSKNLNVNEVLWLTNHSEQDGIQALNPHILSLEDGTYLVLWEEIHNGRINVQARRINEHGNIQEEGTLEARLSDCHPILLSSGQAAWYAADGGQPVLYQLDPWNLRSFDRSMEMLYEDVNPNNWFYEPVKKAFDLKLMSGYDEYTFAPYDSMSRGMAATVLWRISGSQDVQLENPFTDVKAGLYYEKAILWCYQQGIITGYTGDKAGMFGPDDIITRQQLCLMIRNYLKYRGVDVSVNYELNDHPDGRYVSEWARDGIAFCLSKGIVSGHGSSGNKADTRIDPNGYANRAMAAKIFTETVRHAPMIN